MLIQQFVAYSDRCHRFLCHAAYYLHSLWAVCCDGTPWPGYVHYVQVCNLRNISNYSHLTICPYLLIMHHTVCLSIAIYFLPDSPIWLRSKKREKEAANSLQWLKLDMKTAAVPQTLANIESSDCDKHAAPVNKNANDGDSDSNAMSSKVLFTRPVLLPLSIGLVLLIIQQVSGIDAIIFFTVEIFRASGINIISIYIIAICILDYINRYSSQLSHTHTGSSINEHLATIIVGLVQLISNIASLFVVDRAGRKPLLVVSGILMAISTASMGVAFYMNAHGIHDYGYLMFDIIRPFEMHLLMISSIYLFMYLFMIPTVFCH